VRPLFAAIGRSVCRHRRLIVMSWLAAFALGLVGTLQLPGLLQGGGFTTPSSPSQQGQRVMRDRLGFGPAQVTIVFTAPPDGSAAPAAGLRATDEAFAAYQDEALRDVTADLLPGLIAVRTPRSTGSASLVSRDGRSALAVLEFDLTSEQVQDLVGRVRSLLRPTPLATALTGEPAVYIDLQEVSARDLQTVELFTFPIALVVLALVFGTLVAAGLPLAGGGIAVTITLGLFSLFARAWDLSIFAMNTATLLGLAVGIDYALFVVGRFREELARGRPVDEATEITVATAGRSIFFSGVAVVVGLLALMLVPYMSMRSIALGGSLVVVISVLSALTLLPALLALLGPRLDRLRLVRRRPGDGSFWERWSASVMRRPWPVLVVAAAVMLAVAWPALRIQVEIPGVASLPEDVESRRGYDLLQREFDPGALSPIAVVVTLPDGEDPLDAAVLDDLVAFGRELERAPGVERVDSVVTVSGASSAREVAAFWRALAVAAPVKETAARGAPQGSGADVRPLGLIAGLAGARQRAAALELRARTTAPGTILYVVVPEALPTSTAAQDLAARIAALPPPGAGRLYVAGASMTVHDYVTALYDRFPWIVAIVLAVTFAVLLLFLRSLLLPFKAVLVNLLSLLAGYGAMVWVFQDGHLERLLGFLSAGSVDADLPILLFCTAFGVSMDYEVFLLSRMREEWLASADNERAVGRGLARTGRIVTSAALIIVVVAGSFAFTSIVVTKAIGVGLAVAVALDATVVRVLLVPAAMRLLGAWNWWLPATLERRLPRIE
jgi:RND superfamily putative drug exporter